MLPSADRTATQSPPSPLIGFTDGVDEGSLDRQWNEWLDGMAVRREKLATRKRELQEELDAIRIDEESLARTVEENQLRYTTHRASARAHAAVVEADQSDDLWAAKKQMVDGIVGYAAANAAIWLRRYVTDRVGHEDWMDPE